METDTTWLNIEEKTVIADLAKAGKSLSGEKDLGLDLSSIQTIDSAEVKALQEFGLRAEETTVKVLLRGVNVNVYKTLKLAQVTQCFSFLN